MKEILKDKIICISGVTSGIGLALANEFISCGAKVIGFGSQNAESYLNRDDLDKKAMKEGRFEIVDCDISSEKSVRDLVRHIISVHGRIDIFINNAGVGNFKPIFETTIESFDQMVSTNLRGAFLLMRDFGKLMVEQHEGIILNVNSVTIKEIFTSCGVYTATKAGLKALSDTLRKEIRHSGVKVVDLLLGATVSNIWSKSVLDKYSQKMISPSAVADVVATNLAILLAKPEMMIEEIKIKPQLGDL
jgi:NAD(P)-dependent dehydrogenase (short-subunit alcohol dehydrogenase family)